VSLGQSRRAGWPVDNGLGTQSSVARLRPWRELRLRGSELLPHSSARISGRSDDDLLASRVQRAGLDHPMQLRAAKLTTRLAFSFLGFSAYRTGNHHFTLGFKAKI